MAHLTGAELKVILYIARRTYGFGKDGDSISLRQMVDGIVKRNGERLDCGTGLGKDTVCKTLVALEAKCLITRQRREDDRGDLPSYYALNQDAEFPCNEDGPIYEKVQEGSRENPTPLVGEIQTPPSREKSDSPSGNNPDSQETEFKRQSSRDSRQETEKQDTRSAQGVLVSPAVRSKQLSVSSKTQIQESFEAFWKLYPNRVAKQAAWAAWQKIKPAADLLEAILEAIPKQSSYRAACESRRVFCPSWPHPATWLNGQRWTDACELPTGGQLISHTGGMDVVYKETLARVEAFDEKYGIQRD